MVAHCQMPDGATDRGDDTRALMTVNRGIWHLEIAVTGVQIGMANAGRGNLDQHFVGSRRIEIEAVKFEDARLLFHYSRGDTHVGPFLQGFSGVQMRGAPTIELVIGIPHRLGAAASQHDLKIDRLEALVLITVNDTWRAGNAFPRA